MERLGNSNFVYVISDGENHKIGISKDPIGRLKQLEQQLKKRLTILLSINCKDARGCERELHWRFKDYGIHGEWFKFPDMAFLAQVWDVCTNNIVNNTSYYAEGWMVSQEAPDVQEIIDNYDALTFALVNKKINGRFKGTSTLPRIMQRMGCVKVTVVWDEVTSNIYITPKGLEKGLHKIQKKELRKYLNVPIEENNENISMTS